LLALVARRGAARILLTRPHHLYYVLGVEPPAESAAALLVAREGLRAVWPEGIAVPDLDVLHYGGSTDVDDFAAACVRQFAAVAGEPLLVDADVAPLGLAGVRDGRHVLHELVRTKDADEVATIRENLAGNDAAFEAVGREFRVGMTDFDVMALCLHELAVRAGGPVAYEANIGLDALGGNADAQPGGAVAGEGSVVFVDLYPRRAHYVGDSTRSFALEPVAPWIVEAHGRLEAALEAGERLLRPGVAARTIDAACRAAAAGPAGTYAHHTGHGLGLTAPEPPYLVPGSRDEIRVGDVVALEPGYYVPGSGGMRLEDVFLVTEDGPVRLNAYPRRLTLCG
jgi:Xaa-Pro aminopeptidase